MKRWYFWYPILAAVLVGAVALSLYAAGPDSPIQAERYIPDPERLFPAPGPRAPSPTAQPRVVHADSIVLQGPDVQIVITATGVRPGITMTHRSGHVHQIYFAADGRAVYGILEPRQTRFSAALWTHDGRGILQMRDARGTYLMRPHEIYRGAPVR